VYSLQLRIALRAASLLEVGGLMVYSTCSMNPFENEASVAALLRGTGGAFAAVYYFGGGCCRCY
jgi:16S rRNA C967 or C1407 C5-methylase (RsmB/RsmF family)